MQVQSNSKFTLQSALIFVTEIFLDKILLKNINNQMKSYENLCNIHFKNSNRKKKNSPKWILNAQQISQEFILVDSCSHLYLSVNKYLITTNIFSGWEGHRILNVRILFLEKHFSHFGCRWQQISSGQQFFQDSLPHGTYEQIKFTIIYFIKKI